MFSLGIIIFFSSFMLEYLALLQQLECLALLQQLGPVRNFFVTHSGDDFVPTIWKKCGRMLGLGLTQCWGYAVWVVRDDLRAAVAIMSQHSLNVVLFFSSFMLECLSLLHRLECLVALLQQLAARTGGMTTPRRPGIYPWRYVFSHIQRLHVLDAFGRHTADLHRLRFHLVGPTVVVRGLDLLMDLVGLFPWPRPR